MKNNALIDRLSVIDDKTLVSTYSAFFALEKGKRIRNETWDENEYVVFNDYGILVDESGTPLDITIDKGMKWYVLD